MASRARAKRDDLNKLEAQKKKDKVEGMKNSLKLILSSEHGSVLLDELKRFCYEGIDVADTSNVNQTYYNLGRQSVLLHINKLIEE